MHHLGFAQRFGLGVPLARRLLAANRQSRARVPFRTGASGRDREDCSVNCITVFNNKGGVGKTSLVYHLAWMYAELDYNVLVADLDPQANLTSMFLDDDELEELWTRDGAGGTIYSALRPLLEGTGDVTMPHVVEPETGIGLVAGDMLLSGAEDELSSQWPDCLDRKQRAFRVLSALWRGPADGGGRDEGRADSRGCRSESRCLESSRADHDGSRGRTLGARSLLHSGAPQSRADLAPMAAGLVGPSTTQPRA